MTDLREIQAEVKEVFRELCCGLNDQVAVRSERGQIRVDCCFAEPSGSGLEVASVQFRFDPGRAEMWIRALEVAPPYRLKGIGRRVVRGVEAVYSEVLGAR